MDKILILGAGKSGRAAEKLLKEKYETVLWDDKFEGKLPDVSGFSRLIISPGISLKHPLAQAAYSAGIPLSGELELAFENCPGQFIAITGTNGKTTTTSLVGEICKNAGMDIRVCGNIGLPVCEALRESTCNTKMITEVSSFQLETVKEFKPHISCILNLSPDHLDRHGSYEEYIRCKSLVFAKQGKDDFFVFNEDDELCCRLAESCSARAVPFSRRKSLPFEIYNIKIPGAHNMENVLAAAAIAECMGVSDKIIRDTAAMFPGVEHRMEFVREFKGVRYINDSKGTNPDSSIKAVEASTGPIILIAGGYEKNSDFTEFIQSFNGKVKKLLLMGATAKRFAQRAEELDYPAQDIIFCENMKECIGKAQSLAGNGWTVLLSPASASWGMYSNFEERGRDFKNLVNSLN